MLGSSANQIEAANATFYVRTKPERFVSYLDVVERGYAQGVQFKLAETFTAPRCEYDHETSQGTTYLQYTYGAVTAEVEVDTETGRVEVLRMVTAYDVGKTINPLSLEGQIEGGTVQGLGYATMEELIHKNGRVVNPNLADYYIPTSLDMPEMKDDRGRVSRSSRAIWSEGNRGTTDCSTCSRNRERDLQRDRRQTQRDSSNTRSSPNRFQENG